MERNQQQRRGVRELSERLAREGLTKKGVFE